MHCIIASSKKCRTNTKRGEINTT